MTIKVLDVELRHYCTGLEMKWRDDPKNITEVVHMNASDLLVELESSDWEKSIMNVLERLGSVPCLLCKTRQRLESPVLELHISKSSNDRGSGKVVYVSGSNHDALNE